jgi:hypothetical protein
MQQQTKRAILETRLAKLREHVENVGDSPRFQQEIAKAEAELSSLQQQTPEPAR